MRILLIGKNGQVGRELLPLLTGSAELLAVGHQDCDLTVHGAVKTVVRAFRPEIIVNCAAYTAVNDAESHPDLAYAINADAPGLLAALALEHNATLIHYSTDYVYNGSKCAPWVESDPTGPLNIYGATKLQGDNAVQSLGGRHLILRTSWVYGPHGSNFLLTIRRLAAEREELKVVSDQIGAPTSAIQIAKATAHIVKLLGTGRKPDSGVYHMTAAGWTSWYGFAQAIVDSLPDRASLPLRRLIPIRSEEYPTPARRPLNSVLDNTKLVDAFGFQIAEWDEGLKEVFASISQFLSV